jgi:DNA-binding sugar fermentation-stimulating protein
MLMFSLPTTKTDPKFGKALRDAATQGVEVYAYYSEFTGKKIVLRGKIKVELVPHH